MNHKLVKESDLREELENIISSLSKMIDSNSHLADFGIGLDLYGRDLQKLGKKVIDRHYENQEAERQQHGQHQAS